MEKDPARLAPLMPRKSSRPAIGAFLVGASLVFWALIPSFFVVELAARLYITRLADEEQFMRYASLSQVAARLGGKFFVENHRYLGYRTSANYAEKGVLRHNALGYRGAEIVLPKPAGEFRIACLGSSTTYDDCIEDYRQAYPAMLEQELRQRGYNATVVNAGVSGWTSYEDMINYALRVSYLQVDMVILYEAFNDLCARIVWPSEAYQGDNSGMQNNDTPLSFGSVLETSSLCRMLLVRIGAVEPQATLTRTFNHFASTFHANDFLNQALSNTYPKGIFQSTPLSVMLDANRPLYYAQNIKHLLSMANQDKVQALLVTFARSPEAFGAPGQVGQGGREFLAGLDEMNKMLEGVALETGAPLLDLAQVYPANKEYWSDMIHNNEAGAAVKARLIADGILQRQMIPETCKLTGGQTPPSK